MKCPYCKATLLGGMTVCPKCKYDTKTSDGGTEHHQWIQEHVSSDTVDSEEAPSNKRQPKKVLLWLCILLIINGVGRYRLKNELKGSWSPYSGSSTEVVFYDNNRVRTYQYDYLSSRTTEKHTSTWMPVGWRTIMLIEPKTLPTFYWVKNEKIGYNKTFVTFKPELHIGIERFDKLARRR